MYTNIPVMKIEKRIYKVFYKGKLFSMSFLISTGVEKREKVSVPRKILNPKS